MARAKVRIATPRDLDLLVRHRRGMWEAIADISTKDLDSADRVYRRWASARMRSRRFAGFVVDVRGEPVSSGCVWLMEVQPRPNANGTTAAYLLSMFTEPAHRGKGHATRIVRAAMRWAKARGVPTMVLHASRFGAPIYTSLEFERTWEMRRSLDRRSRRPRRGEGKSVRHSRR